MTWWHSAGMTLWYVLHPSPSSPRRRGSSPLLPWIPACAGMTWWHSAGMTWWILPRSLTMTLFKICHELNQGVHGGLGYGVVEAGSHAAHATVPLEVEQPCRFRFGQEGFIKPF